MRWIVLALVVAAGGCGDKERHPTLIPVQFRVGDATGKAIDGVDVHLEYPDKSSIRFKIGDMAGASAFEAVPSLMVPYGTKAHFTKDGKIPVCVVVNGAGEFRVELWSETPPPKTNYERERAMREDISNLHQRLESVEERLSTAMPDPQAMHTPRWGGCTGGMANQKARQP